MGKQKGQRLTFSCSNTDQVARMSFLANVGAMSKIT